MTFKEKWKRFNKRLEQTNSQWKKFLGKKFFLGGIIVLIYWMVVIFIPLAILMKVDMWLTLLVGVPWVFLGEAYIWPFYITNILRLLNAFGPADKPDSSVS